MKVSVTIEQFASKLGASESDVKELWMQHIIVENGFVSVFNSGAEAFMKMGDFKRLKELNLELKSEYLTDDYSEKEISSMKAEKEILSTKKYTVSEAFDSLS